MLAGLDALLWGLERDMASLAGGIEHGFLEGSLHGRQRVDGEGSGHDAPVALVVPFVGIGVVFRAVTAPVGRLRGLSKRNHGEDGPRTGQDRRLHPRGGRDVTPL